MKQQMVLFGCMASLCLAGCTAIEIKKEQLFPPVVVEEDSRKVTPKGSWQEAAYLPEDLQTMVEPADAILMAMVESGEAYVPKDPDFFWHALYLFLGMYSENHLLVEVSDASLRVPRKVAQEYATALFYEYDELLPLPESMADFVTYSEAEDAYYLGRGDRGLSESVITRWAEEGDEAYYLEVEMRSTMDDQVIQSAIFLVQKSEYTDGMTNPTYHYQIANVFEQDEEP